MKNSKGFTQHLVSEIIRRRRIFAKRSELSAGFSAIEGILILVIVGLIGGVGWYVWDAKQNADKSLNQASQTEITGAAKKKEEAKSTIPEGYTEYKIDALALKFNYPKEWGKATEQDLKDYREAEGQYGSQVPVVELKFENLKKEDYLRIWKKTAVSISVGVSAPSYCTFNSSNNKWEYTKGSFGEEPCSDGSRTSGSTKVEQFSASAIGAYRFKEAFAWRDYFMEFHSAAAYPEDFDVDKEPAEIKSGVKDRVQKFVKESVDKLVKGNT